jgi:hypothetical protein
MQLISAHTFAVKQIDSLIGAIKKKKLIEWPTCVCPEKHKISSKYFFLK